MIGLRLSEDEIKRVDRWAKRVGHRSRSEAIRALIEQGLKGAGG
jgi:metal-responsive CopG/Arc/MetJ family transcriptional regulator